MTLITGRRGKVVFKAPFDSYNSDKEWTVVANDTIPHLISFGINILQDVYEKQGLTETDYGNDIIEGVNIIGVADDGQFLLYVPMNRIELDETEHPYEYVEQVLTLALPPLPVGYNLTELMNDLKTVVKEKIGYEVNAESVFLSGKTMVNAVDHNIMLEKLNLPTIEKRGYKTKYLQEVEKNTMLNKIVIDLKKLVVKVKNEP